MHKIKSILPVLFFLIAPILILLSMICSILFGSKSIQADIIFDALLHFDQNNVDHQIIHFSRIPRAIGAFLIGCFLAISGSVMQGMTRNYLASPSIMGVSDGSVLMITCCMIFFPSLSNLTMVIFSFIGSAIAAGFVFLLASSLPDGMQPVKMAIIGTIIGTFLSSVATALATYFQTSQDLSFWYNSRLHQIDPLLIKVVVPFAIIGLTLAIGISRQITVLSLGSDVATGLGQKDWLVKSLAILVVVILTGCSVALAGNIGFVGLIIPHISRFLVGVDYKWTIPFAGILGGTFLVFADIGSRFLNYPFETPISVVTAAIGVPFFLYLIKNRGGGSYVTRNS
ncbi:iron complex transport system permease protein [Gracilibacillus ureilyticus]|uniref:Iron complex transport system permease protein n=1 Tax=Gracilibacillus ureilyticus TaxID=531814 RepID=A0A1H9MTZ8_9BACI|nr:iron ABC transporter permease [Gracilibacillus ureilyticus]SER26885.1 iron complex transport system permease protein [Gracilibacillus ureilyticus]